MTRNEKILALRGKLSFGLIAKQLDISRNIVAGVCFRADHRITLKIRRAQGFGSTNGRGRGSRGRPYAEITKFTLGH